ncbi:hypothetical protein [Primorskyibacter flagellatus]|uniref:Uncharacterized protein n=1 Tax=Primorskyibacter flagellatus TaxID=1387277 RepID=A0A1W2E3T5_9RHOB|nr:hypothetical protein [Primorskyibacter flagellatus]SMD04531.1 hypothetical protein SAMN06295998_12210 [Primorskyibacter flagellatus]
MDRETVPNSPIETLRDGRLKASLWLNENDKGSYYTVSLAKVYEDRDGKLKETNSFSAGELLRVAELAREAHGEIRERNREHAIERRVENQSTKHVPERFQR